jgi:hypothetical protein
MLSATVSGAPDSMKESSGSGTMNSGTMKRQALSKRRKRQRMNEFFKVF